MRGAGSCVCVWKSSHWISKKLVVGIFNRKAILWVFILVNSYINQVFVLILQVLRLEHPSPE